MGQYCKLLTILGLKGGLTFLASSASQLISLKKGWFLIADSPPCPDIHPSLRPGSFIMNCNNQQKFMLTTDHTEH